MANAIHLGKTNSVLLFGDYGTEVIRLSQLYDPVNDKYQPVGYGLAAGTAIAPSSNYKYFTYTQRRRTLTFTEVPSTELSAGGLYVDASGNFTEYALKNLWKADADDETLSTETGHYVPVIKTLVVADTNNDKWGDNTLLIVTNVEDGTVENDKAYRTLVDTANNSTDPAEKAAAQAAINEYVPMYKSTLEPINFSAGIENPTRAVDYSNDTFALYVDDVELKNIGSDPTQHAVTQKITLDRRLMMYGQSRLRYVITRDSDRSSTVVCTNSLTTEKQTAPAFIDFIPVDEGTSVAGITPDWFSDNVGKTVVYFNGTGVRCTAQIVLPPIPGGPSSTAEQRKREAIETCALYQELLESFNAGNQIYVHDHPDTGLANLQMPDLCYRRTNVSELIPGEELTIHVYEYFIDAGSDYIKNIDDYRQVMSLHVTVKPGSSLAQYDVASKNIVGFEVFHKDSQDTGDVWDISLSNLETSSAAAIRTQIDAELGINPQLKYDDGSFEKLDSRDPAFRVYGLDELYDLAIRTSGQIPQGFEMDILFKYYPHLAYANRRSQIAQQSTRYSRVHMATARLDNVTSNIFDINAWWRLSGSGTSAATTQKSRAPNRCFFSDNTWRYYLHTDTGNPTIGLTNYRSDNNYTLITPAFYQSQTEIDGSAGHEFTASDKQYAYRHIAGNGNINNATIYSMQVEDVAYSLKVSFNVRNALTDASRPLKIGMGFQFWSAPRTSGSNTYLEFLGYKRQVSNTIQPDATENLTFDFVIPEGTRYVIPVFESCEYDTLAYIYDVSIIRTAVVQYKTKSAETAGRVGESNRVKVRRKDARGNWLTATYGGKTYDAVYGNALATTPSSKQTYLLKDANGDFVLAEGTGKIDAFLDDSFMVQQEDGTFLTLDGPEYAEFNKGVETPYYIRTSSLSWDNLVNRPNRAFIAVRKRLRISDSTPLSVRKIVPIPCWHEETQSYTFTYLVYKSDYKAPMILGSTPDAAGYVTTKNFPVVNGSSDAEVTDFQCNDLTKIYGLIPVGGGGDSVDLEYIPGLNATSIGGGEVKHLVYAFNALNAADYAVKWLYAEPDGYSDGGDGTVQITTANINDPNFHVYGRAGNVNLFRRPYLECVRHSEAGKNRYRYRIPYDAANTAYGFPDLTTGGVPNNWFVRMFYDMAIFPSDTEWSSGVTPTHFRVRHPTISGYVSDPIPIPTSETGPEPIYCDTALMGSDGTPASYDFHLPIPTERTMEIAVVEFMEQIEGEEGNFRYLMGVPVEVKWAGVES